MVSHLDYYVWNNFLAHQYLKNKGYQSIFSLIDPDNIASQNVFIKNGYKKYQTIVYRRLLFLRYYLLKDCDTKQKKFFWHVKGIDHKLWNTFSKIQDK